jgi:hypothetical protein
MSRSGMLTYPRRRPCFFRRIFFFAFENIPATVTATMKINNEISVQNEKKKKSLLVSA